MLPKIAKSTGFLSATVGPTRYFNLVPRTDINSNPVRNQYQQGMVCKGPELAGLHVRPRNSSRVFYGNSSCGRAPPACSKISSCEASPTHRAAVVVIEMLIDISLYERARLVHPSPGNRHPSLLGGPFQRFFIFLSSLFALSVHIFPLFSSFVSCPCKHSEHGTVWVSPAPSRV